MPLVNMLGVHSMIGLGPKGRVASFSMGKHPKGLWPRGDLTGSKVSNNPCNEFFVICNTSLLSIFVSYVAWCMHCWYLLLLMGGAEEAIVVLNQFIVYNTN